LHVFHSLRGSVVTMLERAGVCREVNVEIVKRSDIAKEFVVLPKRWIVERTIAWLNRCRRLAKDWECLNRSALAFLRWASIKLMVRRLCQEKV
jgi:transposase